MDEYFAWELCAEDLEDSSLEISTSSLFQHQQSPGPTNAADNAQSPGISVSVSTIFFPESNAVDAEPDTVVVSCDGVVFYVNSAKVSAAGGDGFPLTRIQEAWIEAPESIAHVADKAPILTVILCAIYNISASAVAPTTDDICAAIDQMPSYGLDPKALVQKGSELYTLLLTHHAPLHPLLVFSTAACHEIEVLAQDVSSHLLGLETADIDDASALKMGSSYLRRLILMNTNRISELKRIVANNQPKIHPLGRRTRGCSHAIQTAMVAEWGFAMKELLMDAKSGMPPSDIRHSVRQAAEELPCHDCKENWNECADTVATLWAQIKFTI